MAYTDIDKPSDYFNTVLYTGNDTDDHAITGVGFQPDWTWIKSRTQAKNHALFDSVRGANEMLHSNTTDAEDTTTDKLKSFDSDGFTLGDDASSDEVNNSGNTFASWNWLASNTTASNTDGSITSTVSANTTSGFSIVSYTGNATAGATIGHGLGVVPKAIFYKNRDQVLDWSVYTEMVGNNEKLQLNLANASTSSAHYNSTTPTSSVFTVGSSNRTNGSGDSMIAYCFAPKKGFSAMGSYTGNGSTDGTFVYTGFKPAWIMLKCSSSNLTNWFIQDNKRNPYNVVDKYLNADSTALDSTADLFDITSNGFKQRNNYPNLNGSGSTYIYMAFAENPFVTSTGIPTTAR